MLLLDKGRKYEKQSNCRKFKKKKVYFKFGPIYAIFSLFHIPLRLQYYLVIQGLWSILICDGPLNMQQVTYSS